MSTTFPTREQLRQIPAPGAELPFYPCFFHCVKVGSKLGGWISALDADWQIRWLWQWWLVPSSLSVSRLCRILPSESPLCGATKAMDTVVESNELTPRPMHCFMEAKPLSVCTCTRAWNWLARCWLRRMLCGTAPSVAAPSHQQQQAQKEHHQQLCQLAHRLVSSR